MNTIAQVDANTAFLRTLEGVELCFRNARQAPFALYGLQPGGADAPYRRMPEAIAATVNAGVEALNRHTSGGRVRFCTILPAWRFGQACLKTEECQS